MTMRGMRGAAAVSSALGQALRTFIEGRSDYPPRHGHRKARRVTPRARLTDLFYGYLDELAERIGGPLYLTDPGLSRRCPKAGLYFFFEHGEARPNGRPRVVRIGTHALMPTSRTTLWGRLGQHRGQSGGANPGGGNHRGSIFRRHVGSGFLNQRGDNSQLLASWMAPGPYPDQVQAELSMTLLCLSSGVGRHGCSVQCAVDLAG